MNLSDREPIVDSSLGWSFCDDADVIDEGVFVGAVHFAAEAQAQRAGGCGERAEICRVPRGFSGNIAVETPDRFVPRGAAVLRNVERDVFAGVETAFDQPVERMARTWRESSARVRKLHKEP